MPGSSFQIISLSEDMGRVGAQADLALFKLDELRFFGAHIRPTVLLYDLGMAEGCWRDDRDAVKAIQNEEIGVSGNDDIGAAVDRQFEKFIVFWVTARSDAFGNRHQFSIRKYLA
jgi:hypothetical protein